MSSDETRFPPMEETEEQSRRIRDADEALERRPDDPDAIVAAALAREEVWRYREAIELYSRGEELAPGDYRFPLGRAHRTMRLRRFREARADLDRALALDPYGFNTAYLRGLIRYLLGDFEGAVDEYDRAFALAGDADALALARDERVPGDPRHCMRIATDPATRIAVTTWTWRALRRAGRAGDAAALLDTLDESLRPAEPPPDRFSGTLIRPDSNAHYFRTLALYRGHCSPEDVLDSNLAGQWPTVAYGVAVWHLVEGRQAAARELMVEIVEGPHWARFGHVAAEADAARLE